MRSCACGYVFIQAEWTHWLLVLDTVGRGWHLRRTSSSHQGQTSLYYLSLALLSPAVPPSSATHNCLFVPRVNSSCFTASQTAASHQTDGVCVYVYTGRASLHKTSPRRLASLILNPFTETSQSLKENKCQKLKKKTAIASQKSLCV